MTFWAVFFGLVLIPIMALSMELGRYFYAKAEVGKAADAAALAAAAEIDPQQFEASGNLVPTGKTWTNAQYFASLNNATLTRFGIQAAVTGITVMDGNAQVGVQVSADVSPLFPSFLPPIIVTEAGTAEIRAFAR